MSVPWESGNAWYCREAAPKPSTRPRTGAEPSPTTVIGSPSGSAPAAGILSRIVEPATARASTVGGVGGWSSSGSLAGTIVTRAVPGVVRSSWRATYATSTVTVSATSAGATKRTSRPETYAAPGPPVTSSAPLAPSAPAASSDTGAPDGVKSLSSTGIATAAPARTTASSSLVTGWSRSTGSAWRTTMSPSTPLIEPLLTW